MKAGWKTSEFWMSVTLTLGLVSAACVAVLPPKWAAVSSALSVAAYTISRGLAKTQPHPAPVVPVVVNTPPARTDA